METQFGIDVCNDNYDDRPYCLTNECYSIFDEQFLLRRGGRKLHTGWSKGLSGPVSSRSSGSRGMTGLRIRVNATASLAADYSH